MIMNFAYVEIFENDSLSKLICLSCIEKLIATYDFKDLIVNSDTQLRLQNDMFEKPDDEMQESCSVSQPDEESECILKKDHFNVKTVINRSRLRVD
ncbi:hypothetical protein MTP99_008058 [Tenebrio molitor]|nr:hypothetical protein MTP99_008058 [Tenebrio molitor]